MKSGDAGYYDPERLTENVGRIPPWRCRRQISFRLPWKSESLPDWSDADNAWDSIKLGIQKKSPKIILPK